MRWLKNLPDVIHQVAQRWELTVGAPFEFEEGSCAWVAPVRLAKATDAVLKLAMPHMEGDHEIHGLHFWNGEPTVRLLEADEQFGALLLERCVPGNSLRVLSEPEQDIIIAKLLRRLWRSPSTPHPFRPLSSMIDLWSRETIAQSHCWPDDVMVREGLRLFSELAQTGGSMLLATDLHAGNVLRAQRQPWLVIDPKPFVGDPAYDATQHLLNCRSRLLAAPHETIYRFADLLDLDRERVRLWTFARAAAESRDNWNKDSKLLAVARSLARSN